MGLLSYFCFSSVLRRWCDATPKGRDYFGRSKLLHSWKQSKQASHEDLHSAAAATPYTNSCCCSSSSRTVVGTGSSKQQAMREWYVIPEDGVEIKTVVGIYNRDTYVRVWKFMHFHYWLWAIVYWERHRSRCDFIGLDWLDIPTIAFNITEFD